MSHLVSGESSKEGRSLKQTFLMIRDNHVGFKICERKVHCQWSPLL